MLGYVWGLWDNNVALNQLSSDWYVLSWSAKWLDSPPNQVMYADQRDVAKIENDKEILKLIWELLDQADIVITQNGKAFDTKKLNARFIMNDMQPPGSYKQIDTLLIAKKHFAFTSNKLEYMSDKLCTKYKKLKHTKFPGFEMWRECLAGNEEAWNEMERYNRYDVLTLEELYHKLIPWEPSINFDLYHDEVTPDTCKCGGTKFKRNGYAYTATAKLQKFKCINCGAETRSRKNLFSKDKKASLKVATTR